MTTTASPSASPSVSSTASSVDDTPAELADLLATATRRASAPSRPRVAVIGNYGNGNLGDEAILRGVLEALGDDVDVTVLSRRPERVQSLHGVASVSMLTLGGVRALLRSDLVGIGGGGIFGNNMGLLPRLLPFVGLALSLLGRDVAFVAIGAYRTTPPTVRWALRRLARRAALVTVRDEESRETLGAPSAHLVPDPGGRIRPAPAAEVDRWFAEAGSTDAPLLGISLKPAADPEVDARQFAAVEQAVLTWRTAHPDGRLLLLCLSDVGNFGLGETVSDVTMAARVAAAFPAVEVTVAPPDLTPWLMKGLIGRCDAVVAHRLHAQLFAHDEGVPLFGLTWERKSDVFLAAAGVPHLNLRTATGDDVSAWLEGVVADRTDPTSAR